MTRTIFLLIIASISTEAAYNVPADFCQKVEEKCKAPRKHLYCGGSLERKEGLGTHPAKMELDSELKQLIMDSHNERCVTIASSGKTGMEKFRWNDELEWTANLNGKTCANNHDCNASQNNLWVGQNLATSKSSQPMPMEEILKSGIKSWFGGNGSYNERMIKDDNMKELEELEERSHKIMTHIGCVVYDCGKADLEYTYYLVCNYREAPPVYEVSADADQQETRSLAADIPKRVLRSGQNESESDEEESEETEPKKEPKPEVDDDDDIYDNEIEIEPSEVPTTKAPEKRTKIKLPKNRTKTGCQLSIGNILSPSYSHVFSVLYFLTFWF